MSFRFNFSCNDDHKIERNTNLIETNTKKVQWLESEEITVDTQIEQLDSMVQHAKMFICGDNIEIGHVVANEAVANIISEDGVQNGTELAESNHSDLITGKYEGGLKIWEGTTDLIEYLIESVNKNQWKEANVLDLGCGAGILGIYSLLNGAYTTFQDYNKEVIKYVTIPNVLLNLEDDSEMCITRCKFYCGDWSSFNKKLDNSKPYDIILTSETIYNEENYDKLIEIFLQRLSKNGSAYVAAKTCYFGVGGGTRQFEKRIEKCGSLKSEVCWKSTGGIQREILKITHTSQQ
ncbi:histidine protein methyltransferase 1 homolog [Galleria mellonella]|uniref:protein-histidine N-methyltransferase n=1 Tax=Galleria mellonella TaxID=7137 RepID=A0A6J1X6D2_GALME|nr:histidine protein methyltransferase 1 homolog [Galleria mellonella]